MHNLYILQILLSESEEDLLVRHEVGVAHCPSSNFYVLSGVCAVRRLLDKGIKVGLGSDISGGMGHLHVFYLLTTKCV